ncbi:MAG: deoxyribonuclease [Pirellulaceae bacterium]|nr:MAG: deoxyribonuclease [Pirellulaceae bacterium]
MFLVDTHAHLDDPQFADLAAVLERAHDAGVMQIVCVATDRASSCRVVQIAEGFPGVFAAVGIHPTVCHQAQEKDWERIQELTRSPRVVALGETGLDRYWDEGTIGVQEFFFQRHLELSQQTGLPVVIHMRDCAADIERVLGQAAATGPLRGVMHSYSGDWRLAKRCLEWGLHISFSGMVTYKKNEWLREVARQVPDDRLLVETDAPYLPPEPQRGRRPNEPALLVHTAECLARVRNVSVAELADQTARNARQLFRLPDICPVSNSSSQ